MKSIFAVSAVVAVLAVGSALFAQEKPAGEKPKEAAKQAERPKCMIMPEELIDFSVKTMTSDGPVYFCCGECIDTFKKEPAKYAKDVKAQREALQKMTRIQVTCPVGGEPIDKKVSIEKDGKKVYFCCDQCKGKYEGEPAKFAAKLEDSYTYQAKCPVMGKTVAPDIYVDLATGQRVYLCCKMCEGRMKSSPEKYLGALEAQGIYVDAEKLKGAPKDAKPAESKDSKKP